MISSSCGLAARVMHKAHSPHSQHAGTGRYNPQSSCTLATRAQDRVPLPVSATVDTCMCSTMQVPLLQPSWLSHVHVHTHVHTSTPWYLPCMGHKQSPANTVAGACSPRAPSTEDPTLQFAKQLSDNNPPHASWRAACPLGSPRTSTWPCTPKLGSQWRTPQMSGATQHNHTPMPCLRPWQLELR
jgi:hypothetical protein